MLGFRTWFVDLEKLRRRRPQSITVLRLMMAANDIQVANWGLREFRAGQSRLARLAQAGACRYFVRLQCGHLEEALGVIEEVRADDKLRSLVANCSSDSQEAFNRLTSCLPSGRDHDRFRRHITQVRNNVAFHYSPKLTEKALLHRASRLDAQCSKVTSGSDIDSWRFGVADDLMDTLVCRQLWKIPETADVRSEADRIADFGEGLCKDVLGFGGELAFRFLQDDCFV
jgi:hypothetical protein